jgi:hypothetical protein
MKGWGRGVKEKHPWIMHIWDVGWCPPKQPHLQACISGLSPRRWKSNAWESCLVQASLHGCKPDRPKDIRLCTTDPVGIQFSIGGDVWQENLCLLYTYINPCSHAYNLRRNKALEITYLAHTLLYLSMLVTNYQLLYMFLSSICVVFSSASWWLALVAIATMFCDVMNLDFNF